MDCVTSGIDEDIDVSHLCEALPSMAQSIGEPRMTGDNQKQRKHRLRKEHHERCLSISSNNTQLNRIFFGKDQIQPQPLGSHTNTSTWKSQEVKDRDEYNRLRQRVRHIAPEQFKKTAKPTNQPCDIFPQTVNEWKHHKADMLGMVCAQKLSDAKKISAQAEALQKIPKEKRPIKSVFGNGGKVFDDCRGPVLGQPTIWSAEFDASELPHANWPGFAELHWNGDSRENKLAKTRCGRFFPAPRAPGLYVGFVQLQPLMKQFPFDQTGPIFDDGPAPIQIQLGNADMDNDLDFGTKALSLLGAELMQEIGES